MRILPLYFIVLGWTSAFALHPWVPVPMILAILMFIFSFFLIIKYKSIPLVNGKLIWLFYCLIVVLILSFIIQTFTIGFQIGGFNHTLSYVGVIFAYFLGVVCYILFSQYPMNKIYKYLSWGVISVSILTIVEFIGRNFFQFEFGFLGINRENIATYSVGGERFLRSRGTTLESGHLAMYLLMFSPFVYHYQRTLKNSKIKMYLSLITIMIAVIFTFSAAGFIEIFAVLITVFIISIFKFFKRGFKLNQLAIAYVGFSSLVISAFYYFIYKGGSLDFLDTIFSKITLVDYSINDSGTRLARWYRALELFKESPIFGQGPGISSLVYETGSTSFYLELLAATGLLGVSIFFLIMLYNLFTIFKLKGNVKYVYLLSFIVMTIHMAVISDYWYPWMWTLFVMINVQYYNQRQENKMVEKNPSPLL